MTRTAAIWPLVVLCPLLLACGDDVAGAPEPNGACTITERVRLVAPPEGWSVEQYGDYDFDVLEDFILYSFDERDDPARLMHRLDRCTGGSTPFPSFTPGMQSPFIVDTPAGRVLYAKKGGDYYVVDRLDDAGDDAPQKIAGLPHPGFLDFDLWGAETRPYAFFWRDFDIYTHAGAPKAPALQVAADIVDAVPYVDAILVTEQTGDVRRIDPYTGASELLLTGSQNSQLLDPGGEIEDARVLWWPLDADELRIRHLGDGTDVVLTMDPALLPTVDVGWWAGSDGVFMFTDHERSQIVAVVDSTTGAQIEVPAHVAYDAEASPQIGLTLADGDEVVEALWNPKTGALHEWYRGPAPAPSLQAAEATHADYYVAEQVDPPVGSLWRVEFATGERRVLVPRISPWRRPVAGDTELVEFDVGPQTGIGPLLALRDLEYVEIEAGRVTPIAEAVAAAQALPGEGVVWLDVHGAAPGLWVAPPP